MKNSRRIFALMLVIVLSATALAACKPSLTAPEVLSQSITNMRALNTFSYNMHIEMTDQTNKVVVTSEGMFEAPKKSYSKTTQENQTIQTLVLSENEIYIRAADKDAWQQVDLETLESVGLNVDFMDRQEEVWSLYENPVMIDEVDLDGVKCYHLSYSVDVAKYTELMLTGSISSQIDLSSAAINGEMWVGKDDLLMHKNTVTMVYGVSSSEITSISTMTYADLNQPVNLPQP